MDNNLHTVIMAGGVGSRLWPLSTPEKPKQFLDLLGTGKTLIQMTADRFKGICPAENIWVVTGACYKPLVQSQLPDVPESNILCEPASRNTAPCIAYSCSKIRQVAPDAVVTVVPSDAYIIDTEDFRSVIMKAVDFAAGQDAIVTVGISPDRPETGYGYIRAASDAVAGTCNILKVKEFKEKPDLETAKKYLSEGNYLWNAGIFVWKLSAVGNAINMYAPEIAAKIREISAAFGTPDEQKVLETVFPQCPKISIDYAVMEKAPNVYTIPGRFGWSDLGGFEALRKYSQFNIDEMLDKCGTQDN